MPLPSQNTFYYVLGVVVSICCGFYLLVIVIYIEAEILSFAVVKGSRENVSITIGSMSGAHERTSMFSRRCVFVNSEFFCPILVSLCSCCFNNQFEFRIWPTSVIIVAAIRPVFSKSIQMHYNGILSYGPSHSCVICLFDTLYV